MAGAPTADGYQSIRDHIEANWDYIELRDQNGAAITRITTTDTRVVWEHAAGAQTLVLRASVKGSDADIPVPCTIASSALFREALGGVPMAVDAFQYNQVIGSDNDEVVVRHNVSVPKLAA